MPRFLSFAASATIRYVLAFSILLFTLLTACKKDDNVLYPPNPAPTLTAITPDSAFIGDTITITGSGFSTEFIDNVIRFTDSIPEYDLEAYGIVSATPTELRVRVPSGATSGPVTVAIGLGGDLSNALDFKLRFIVQAPIAITDITPDTVYYNDVFTILGRGFKAFTLQEISIGERQFEPLTSFGDVTDTTVRVRVLNAINPAQTGRVFMIFEDGTIIEGPELTIAPPAPVITSFTPESGSANTTLTITGNGFYPNAVTTVIFGGDTLNIDVKSRTEMQVTIPPDAVPGSSFPFVVSNQGREATSTKNFTVTEVVAGTVYMYYTQTRSNGISRDIYRATVTGSKAQTPALIFENPGFGSGESSPEDLVMDAGGNRLYWATAGNNNIYYKNPADPPKAFEAVFSASNRSGPAIGLALGNNVLYWTDTQAKTIKRANVNGSDIRTLYENAEGTDVEVAGDNLYWTDPTNIHVRRGSISGETSLVWFNANNGLTRPVSLEVDAQNRKIYIADGNRILVGDLDARQSRLQVLYGSAEGVVNPRGLAIDVANGKIYWRNRDASRSKIMRGDLVRDPTTVETILEKVSGDIYGLAVQPVQ